MVGSVLTAVLGIVATAAVWLSVHESGGPADLRRPHIRVAVATAGAAAAATSGSLLGAPAIYCLILACAGAIVSALSYELIVWASARPRSALSRLLSEVGFGGGVATATTLLGALGGAGLFGAAIAGVVVGFLVDLIPLAFTGPPHAGARPIPRVRGQRSLEAAVGGGAVTAATEGLSWLPTTLIAVLPMTGSIALGAGAAGSAAVGPLLGTFPEPPVYNAIAEPTGSAPDILLDGVPTRVFFSIGPRDARNMISRPEIAESKLKELNREEAVNLAVKMTCHVCTDTEPQVKDIMYVARLGSSTIAAFNIVPDLNQALARQGSSITFSIDRGGREFDFVKLVVRVRREPARQSSQASARIEVAARVEAPADLDCAVSQQPQDEDDSNLVIHVARTNEGLKIGFAAPDPRLAARLAPLGIKKADGSMHFFKTRATTPDAVAETAGETYLELKTLVEPLPALQKALPDVARLKPQVQQVFDATSRQETLNTLYRLGVVMYDRLFYSGGPALAKVVNAIEEYGDENRNLRILIHTASTYLPWQLLHQKLADEVAPDGLQFWGNKYILGVVPDDEERDCGRLPGTMEWSAKDNAIYAHYWQPPEQNEKGNAPADQVSRLGELFGKLVADTLGMAVRVTRTKSDFVAQVRSHRDALVLWSFTHGHSGDVITTAIDQADHKRQAVVVPSAAGQRLDFSRSDSLTARDLSKQTISRSGEYFFAGRPFVFLNGCETGTQGTRGTSELSLPGTFLIKGARGVVATEAPVWDVFAYNFAGIFLEKLAARLPAGQAMLETRLEFLNEGNNPLGLTYSYYGNPAFRLIRTGS